MKKYGKTITMFLVDADSSGLIACELSNWSGKAYKIPRVKLKDCKDRGDLNSAGVYLLFGKSENEKDQAYIGEAESILKRLEQQLIKQDFWNEAVVFISKDDNLNKAHIKYLEHRFYEIAKATKRYEVSNATTPTKPTLSESDIADMEGFILNARMLVNTLGYRVFEEKREDNKRKEVFYIKNDRGADAQGERTSEGFVVFKGSKAIINTTPSMPESFKKLKEKLVEDKILLEKDGYLEFSDDYIFSSPSAAARIIFGSKGSGLRRWKTKDNKTLKEYEQID